MKPHFVHVCGPSAYIVSVTYDELRRSLWNSCNSHHTCLVSTYYVPGPEMQQ